MYSKFDHVALKCEINKIALKKVTKTRKKVTRTGMRFKFSSECNSDLQFDTPNHLIKKMK